MFFVVFNVFAGDFFMFSNKSDNSISAMDSFYGGNVNFVVEPGNIFEVILIEEGKSLVLNIEGLAGWIDVVDFDVNERFVSIEDNNIIRHFSDDGFVESDRRLSFKLSDFEDSSLKITVSLKGLTVHAVCDEEDFDKVYPVGVGVKGKNGKSVTPTSDSKDKEFFLTWPDISNKWYYIKKRFDPAYFGGFPFLRLNIENDKRQHTYGFHGPITKDSHEKWVLHRGYVSHGCMRMREQDVIELYDIAVRYPGARVYIIDDYEFYPDGSIVDCDYPKKN
jgi:hypothetical protein